MSSRPQNAVVPGVLTGFPLTVIRPERIHWSALRLDVNPAEDNMRLSRQDSSGLKGVSGKEAAAGGTVFSGLKVLDPGVRFG